jgi:hypothetical protein
LILQQVKKTRLQLPTLSALALLLIVPMVSMAGNLSLLTTSTVPIEKKIASSSMSSELSTSNIFGAAQKLQILSQIIAKDYFFISQQLREEQANAEIEQSIRAMDRQISLIHAKNKNEDIANLLTYLQDVVIDFKHILKQDYTKKNGTLVLDYSETLYEGAQSIISQLSSKNEKHNDLIAQQQLILQRISKFYIAYQAGFSDKTMTQQLQKSVAEFEEGVNEISHHHYANGLDSEVAKLQKYWPIAKKFYLGMEKGDLTLIVFISTDHMNSSLNKLILSQS